MKAAVWKQSTLPRKMELESAYIRQRAESEDLQAAERESSGAEFFLSLEERTVRGAVRIQTVKKAATRAAKIPSS